MAITETQKSNLGKREYLLETFEVMTQRCGRQIKCQGIIEEIVKGDFRVLRLGKGSSIDRKLVNWKTDFGRTGICEW